MRQGLDHFPAIYFAIFDDKYPIKIGFSCNVGVRIAILSTAHWKKISRVVAVPGDRKMEKRIHDRFSDQRIGRSEWFHPDTELLQFIEDVDSQDMIDVLRESIALAKKVDIEKVFVGTNGMKKPKPNHPWRRRKML